MKILIIRLFPNEISTSNYNVQEIGIAKAFVKKGHICDIVLYTSLESKKETIKVDNFYMNIYWIKGINLFKNGIYGKELFEIAKEYDIIQSSEYDQIFNLKLQKHFSEKLFIYHGPYYNKRNFKYNLKCKIFDLFFLYKRYKSLPMLTKSELAKEFLEKKGFNNVNTVGVGLDDDILKNNCNNDNLLKIIKTGKRNILYIGKIEKRRNIIFILKVLLETLKTEKDVKLILVGKGNKRYENKVKKYAEKKKITENILFIDNIEQKNIKILYENSEVFFMPTYYDIFGMVLLEAMYYGLQIVTTKNGGSTTLSNNMQNIHIIKSFSVKEASLDIKCALEQSEKNINKRKEIIKFTKDNYLWDKLSDKFYYYYNKGEKNVEKK